jgi:chitodextrinase
MNKNLSLSVVLVSLTILVGLGVVVFNRNLISDTNNQLAGVVGPSISNVKVNNITSTGAVITWTTDKVSSSQGETKSSGWNSVWTVAPYDATNINGLTTHKVTISGLNPSTQYSYRVTSCGTTNSCKTWTSNSKFKTLATTATPTDATAPTAPTNVTASSITQTGATISWTASTDNVGVTGYNIYINGSTTATNVNLITGTNYPVTNLFPGTTYSIVVKAKDAAGNFSSASNAASITITDTIAPTTPVGLTSSNITQTSATISWTASTDNVGVTGYNIYKNGSATPSNSTLITSTTYNASGLTAGTSRTYAVEAIDAAGNKSTISDSLTVVTSSSSTTTTSSSCPNTSTNPADMRDVWAWHQNTDLVTPNSTYQNQFFAFADSHHVKNIYLNANPSFISSSATNIKDFLNKAKAHCMNVEALGGAENWVALPGNPYFTQGTTTTAALDFATAVRNFNDSITGTNAKFSAIQYDTEPYTITSTDGYYPYWNLVDSTYTKEQSNMAIANSLIDMLQAVRAITGNSIKINLAPPRWYDTNTSLQSFNRTGEGVTGKNAMQYMLDEVDILTIQDYVTNATSIQKDASGELNYAASTGKEVRIGLLLDQDTSAPTSTYFGSTCAKLNSDIQSAYNLMSSAQKAVFGGFAIEQYDTKAGYPSSWTAMCQ